MRPAVLLLPFLLVACARESAPAPDAPDTVVAPAPVPGDTAAAPAPAPAPADGAWTVGPTSFGPLRVGMTPEQASAAIGTALAPDYMEGSTCGYAKFAHNGHDVYLMFSEGTLARFDPAATPSPIKTSDGLGVGSTEAQVRAVHPSLEKTLHAYTDGHYLNVAAGEGHYVFETDSTGVVTEFRSGRQPEVGYVEGCS